MLPMSWIAAISTEDHAPMIHCLEQMSINGERPELVLELALAVGFGERAIVDEVVHKSLHDWKLTHEYLRIVVHRAHAQRRADRRCAASSRSVQRPQGARSSAMLCLLGNPLCCGYLLHHTLLALPFVEDGASFIVMDVARRNAYSLLLGVELKQKSGRANH